MGAVELLELQQVDDRLARLRTEIAAVEARLRGSAELDRARADVAAATARGEAVDASVAAADVEATALRGRARTLERQLFGGSVRGAAELVALQRELDDGRARLAGSEEHELALMEDAESAAAALAEAQAVLDAVEAGRRAQAGPDAERVEALRLELADTIAERELEATRLGASERALYTRVAAHHHPAVVRLLGDACGGCRLPLGMREVHEVRSGSGIVQCPNCDRVIAP